MEKTHTYPTIPSDDQPDRSAAHNNLADTYWYNGWVRLTKGTTDGHTYIQLPPLQRLPTEWSSDQYPMLLTYCFCRLGCHGRVLPCLRLAARPAHVHEDAAVQRRLC